VEAEQAAVGQAQVAGEALEEERAAALEAEVVVAEVEVEAVGEEAAAAVEAAAEAPRSS
jgi:hypothetical protein